MIESNQCPDPEIIAALIDGELTGAEREKLMKHVAVCDLCRELIAESMHALDELDLLEEGNSVRDTGNAAAPTAQPDETEQNPNSSPKNIVPFSRWAAPVALAAILLLAFNFLDLGPDDPSIENEAVARGLELYQQSAAQLSRKTLLRYRLPLDPGEELLQLSSGMRGDGDEESTQLMEPITDLFREGLEYNPSDRDTLLYLMSSLILAGDQASAVLAAEGREDDPDVSHLMALALFEMGENQEAIDRMDQLSWRTSPHMAYNMARMLTRARSSRAVEAWQIFLELENEGVHADEARRYIINR